MNENSRGFALIEVLVASLLLAMVLLGVAPMFVYSIRKNAAGADLGQVGAVAVERMELMRGTPYAGLDQGGSLTADVDVGGVPYYDRSMPGYVVRWQITDNATAVGGKRIAVRASALRQVSGMAKEVTLTSLRGG